MFLLYCATVCTMSGGCGESRPSASIPIIRPQIHRTIPHDTAAFTQGLLFFGGKLYESTGLYGQSTLRVIEPSTGRVDTAVRLLEEFFGEGLALCENLLYQLTWRENRVFLYEPCRLKYRGCYRYDGEGWGLTSDGTHLIMSNGSDTLTFLSPAMQVIRRVAVRFKGKALTNINELEFARGSIYANVWYSDFIYRIDPTTGTVTQVIDCRQLVDSAASLSAEHVLNGIAFHPERDVFYLTGKKWPLLFEVSF